MFAGVIAAIASTGRDDSGAGARSTPALVEGVTGTVHPTVRIFKGVPFAAPPLGENRWKAPQPAAKWDGVFKANAFGPSCIAGGGQDVAAAADAARLPGAVAHRRHRALRRGACRTTAGRSTRGAAAAAAGQRRLPDRERLDQRRRANDGAR